MEESRKKMIKRVIKEELFEKYQINESFDSPFNNIEKINDFSYVVKEDGVIGIFTFRLIFNNNELPNHIFYNDKVNTYYEVSWNWDKQMDDKLKTPKNWVRMTSTSFKIMDDFLRTKKPLVLRFSRQTEGNEKIYFNDSFIDKLKSIFGEHFDVYADRDTTKIYLANKEVTKFRSGGIEKLTEMGCMSFEDAWTHCKYPKKNQKKGITRNDMVKEQRKRILYKLKYL